MARQSERREATRAALLAAARSCFMDLGFEGTSTEAVLARAGVSKGALYHHFENKADLLASVFEAVSRDTVGAAQAAARAPKSARSALGAAMKAWLRAALEPEPRRILLETGPAVLGFARARQIEDAVALGPMRRGIELTVADGEAACADVEIVARLLNAALAELALVAIQRDLSGTGLETLDPQIDALVDALLPPPRRD